MEYIHYGSSRFDPLMVKNVSKYDSTCINKPNYGLWASPVDSNWGWKDWCEAEDFNVDRLNESFTFTLKDNANILTIKSSKDWSKILSKIFDYNFKDTETVDLDDRVIVWDYICKNYDGILVFVTHMCYGTYINLDFTSWDCDSIVIFNPDIIILKEEK